MVTALKEAQAAAGGRLRFLQGRYRDALAELKGRQVYEAVGGTNPAVVAWRSQSALAHHQLGETDDAKRLAADEVELSRRWGAPRALAKSLRVAGMIEGGERGLELLEEAVALLQDSDAILERARGLLELGSALRRSNRRSDAREYLKQALELAHRGESASLAARAQDEFDGDRGPPAPGGAQRDSTRSPRASVGSRGWPPRS